jgi:ABC-2 type transport system permease protein
MFGKLLGTYGTGLLQMAILLVITPLVALLLGRNAAVWGSNYLGIVLATMAVVAAASGLGLLLASLGKNARQADTISTAVVLIMAMLGGTFVPVDAVPILKTLSNLSLNFWGIKAYTDLAVEDASLGEIAPALGVMMGMAAVYFGIALWRFNKRLDM